MEEGQEVVNEEPVNTGESTEESATSETAVEAKTEENAEAPESNEEDKQLPFGKHPRWQKMVSSNRELKQKLQDYEQRYSGFNEQEIQGFKAIKSWFAQDPRNIEAFQQLFTRGATVNQPKEEVKDPYAAWEPEVAERFRTVDELKNKIAEFERRDQERQFQEVAREVDGTFTERLKADGYLDEKGFYRNPKLGEMIEGACKDRLLRTAQNPQRPTAAEVTEAYNFVRSCLNSTEKNGLKKLTSNAAPPTGSRSGQVPSGKKLLKTDDDRSNYLANFLGG